MDCSRCPLPLQHELAACALLLGSAVRVLADAPLDGRQARALAGLVDVGHRIDTLRSSARRARDGPAAHAPP